MKVKIYLQDDAGDDDENERTWSLTVKIQKFGTALNVHALGLLKVHAFVLPYLQFASSQCDLSLVLEASPVLLVPLMPSLTINLQNRKMG